MDRFLTGGVDQDEKESIAKNMIKLVDLYYLALDGHKVKYNLMLWYGLGFHAIMNFKSFFFVIFDLSSKKYAK